ncbi:hypothetical protein [Rugamonas sp.]|uniref:hypothetical protein n=1 Tax=Rugamonas sp. TaxID=1926287 RepID=UPI0025CC84E5|nr:hypothetical protein [Rugamonas sp.]
MTSNSKDREVSHVNKVENDGGKRLPSDRDQSPDAQGGKPRNVGKQAASDIEHGLVDTDRYATPGVEKVPHTTHKPAHAQPQPGDKRD